MSRCTDEGHCITCSDEGRPMLVVDAAPGTGLAIASDEGGDRDLVDVTLVAGVKAGDFVLVHAGVALARLEELAR